MAQDTNMFTCTALTTVVLCAAVADWETLHGAADSQVRRQCSNAVGMVRLTVKVEGSVAMLQAWCG